MELLRPAQWPAMRPPLFCRWENSGLAVSILDTNACHPLIVVSFGSLLRSVRALPVGVESLPIARLAFDRAVGFEPVWDCAGTVAALAAWAAFGFHAAPPVARAITCSSRAVTVSASHGSASGSVSSARHSRATASRSGALAHNLAVLALSIGDAIREPVSLITDQVMA